MMIKALILLASVLYIQAQVIVPHDHIAVPNPYQYSYTAPSIGGSSSHSESGDGAGRVTGSYSVVDEDGRTRTVEYVADELGFRAHVVTNEPGTSNQQPADVSMSSSADDGFGGIYSTGLPGALPVGAVPAAARVI